MAVQDMKLVYLSGLFEKLDELSKLLIDCNYFQPEVTYDLLSNSTGFTQINEENPYAVTLSRVGELIDNFGLQAKIGKMPKHPVSDDVAESMLESIEKQLHDLHETNEELLKAREETAGVIDNLNRFSSMNIDLSVINNTEFVHARFGRLPHSSTEKLKLYTKNPYAEFFVASSNEEFDWGVYFCPDDDTDSVDRLFASLFFERIELPQYTGTPADIIEGLSKTLEDIERRLKASDEVYQKFVHENDRAILKLYNQIKRQHDAFNIRNYAARYNKTYLLVGWVPKASVGAFTKLIDSKLSGCEIEFDDPTGHKQLKPPTKLKNSFLFRPFQYFVEIYGVPNYSEVDPTAFVAITYTLLYGIMFADFGQGIVLSIIGFLMYKLKNMPIGKILVPCGISGAFFGLVFGSLFGFEHALDPIYHAIGFKEKPFEVMNNATTLLAFSIGIGVVLVIVAMFFNVVSKLKQRDYGDGIFGHNGICGIVLYGTILTVGLSMVLGVNLPVMPLVLLGVVLPLILIFFKAPLGSLVSGHGFKLNESIGDYILENFFELFEVLLSYFTNTLSFLRVGAFVLIHVGMMTAFFALAEIMGSGFPYVFMVVFGNIFVIALEGLLVGIQVLRLEFYEMFSRFYEGDGKLFKPLNIKAAQKQ